MEVVLLHIFFCIGCKNLDGEGQVAGGLCHPSSYWHTLLEGFLLSRHMRDAIFFCTGAAGGVYCSALPFWIALGGVV